MRISPLKPLRRVAGALARRRTGNPEAGDTLLEVLLALVVLGLASVALLIAFGTTLSASADHREVANYQTMLTSATQEAIYAIQADVTVWEGCYNLESGQFPTLTLPSQYTSGANGAAIYSVNYTSQGVDATSVAGSGTVQYWNGNGGYSTTCPSGGESASMLFTIGIVGTNYTNSFVVASPLSNSSTGSDSGSATGLFFTTQPSGGTIGADAGIPFPTQPVVELESNGSPVSGSLAPVQLFIDTASGSLVPGCSSVDPDDAGIITFSGCTIDTAGDYYIVATAGNLTTTSDEIVVGTADYHLVFTTQPAGGLSGAAFAASPVVSVETAADGVYDWTGTVTETVSGGDLVCSGTTSTTTVVITVTNGVATMPTGPPACTFAGGYFYNPTSGDYLATPYTITATATGGAPAVPATSSTFAVSGVGPEAQLVFTAEPTGVASSSATTVFTGQPSVTIEDSFGNTVTAATNTYGSTHQISLAITNSSTETLAGCTYTLTNGVATFSGCHGTSVGFGSGYIMTASGTSMTTGLALTSAASSPFNITGPPTQLIFYTQPVGGISGGPLSTEPVLQYLDASGNIVTSVTSPVVLTPSGGTLSICTGLVPVGGVVTVANCTFAGLYTPQSITYYTLTATGDGLTATSAPFFLTGAGAAAQLVFTTQPVAGPSGSNFTTQPVIQIEDAEGNLETTSNDSISLSSSTGGLLSGCSGLSAIDGVVEVANCNFSGLDTATYYLTAIDGSLTATSNGFTPSGPGVPALLTLSGCSPTVNAAASCSLSAVISDNVGNVETGDDASSVTFGQTSGTGTVTGLTSETVSGGVATDPIVGSNAGPIGVTATADGFTSNALAFGVLSTSNITVASSGTPSVVGQSVTYTATVSPTSTNSALATGYVEFFDGGTPIGTCSAQPLSGTSTDTATCVIAYTSTTSSPHMITAQYLGNATTYFAPSALSSSISQYVNVAATSTSVVSNINPSVVGQAVTYTATVSVTAPGAGTPTGKVEFFDGGTAITGCTAQTLTSVATCTVTYAATGSHVITAEYLGATGTYAASAMSSPITQVVGTASTTTTVTSSDSTAVTGESITYTATVAPVSPATGSPTGTVEFFDGATPITGCTAKTLSGTGTDTATCTTSYTSTSPSSHSITAVYVGSANYATSTSSIFTETVGAASTSTTLSSSDLTAAVGEPITYTATVAVTAPGAGTPPATDTVAFKDGGTVITGCGAVTISGTTPDTATCTTTYTTTTGSPHTITAVFSGDANFLTSTSTGLSESVSKSSTTTTLSENPTTSVSGQSVTFTATVAVTAPGTGNPTGTVTFKNGATTICNAVTLSTTTETATCAPALNAGSTNSITAVYSGDTNFSTSTSAALVPTVNKASTTTALSASPTTSVSGQSVTFTATVAPTAPGAGNPSGTVTFKNGATTICNAVTLSTTTETATCAVALSAGSTNSITAVYSGDTNFSTSTSAALVPTVNKASTTTTLASSDSTAVTGESITYTATVAVTTPGTGTPPATDTVAFKDGGTTITGCGTVALSGTTPDTATCTTSYTSTTPASHTITAAFSGDTNFSASTSANFTETVSAASTTTTLASSDSTAVIGESITYTATVAVTTPGTGTPPATDTVAFKDGGTTITGCGTVALSGTTPDTATCTTSYTSTTPASHTITAVFSGDANFATSTSANFTESVGASATTTTLTSGTNPSVAGQSVTFTATVAVTSPGTGTPPATDTVAFKSGGTAIAGCTAQPLTGTAPDTATCTTTALAHGSDSITAVFSGDANYTTSTSAALTQTVNTAGTATTLTSGTNPSVAGQSVTFTATVAVTAPGTGTPPATDTVAFKSGGTAIAGCTAQPLSGTTPDTATCTTTALAGGSDSITAVFSGDANYTTSTSNTVTQVVNKAATTTTLTSGTNPSVPGQSVTFTATVAVTAPGTGTPPATDTVAFKSGGTVIAGCGTQALSGTATDTATCTTSFAATGSNSITAVFIGDTNYTTSTSNTVTQTVNSGATTTTLTSSDTTAVTGESITYTATVAVTAPSTGTPPATDTVAFKDGGTTITGCGAEALSGTTPDTAACTVTYTSTTPASHTITAVYAGDANFSGSTSAGLAEGVSAAATTTTVTSNSAPSVVGQSVTFTATVSVNTPGAGTPPASDTINFKDNGTTITGCGTKALSGTVGNDTATCSFTYTAPATHTITAVFSGDANFTTSTSTSLSQVVGAAATTTSVLSNADPSTVNQAVTYTATVSVNAPGAGTPPATDKVDFKDGGTAITGCNAQALSGTVNDTATCTVTYTSDSPATHTITATFSGDTNFTTSTSTSDIQTVNGVGSTTTVTSNVASAVVGQPVTFTATVASSVGGAGTPTGSVEFFNGGSAIGTCTAQPLSGTTTDTATCTVALGTSGTSAITATYGGDSVFLTSNSATFSQTVTIASTTTALASSDATAVTGESITYTATVAAVSPSTGLPTGNVEFLDGTTAITGCTAQPLTGTATDTATCTTSYTSTTPASHSITAVYAGSTNAYKTSTSGIVTEGVSKASTSVVVTSNKTTLFTYQTVTLTATITATSPGAGNPTGTVEFYSAAGTPIASCTAQAASATSPDTATCSTYFTTSGTRSITATYSGDTNYLTSTSSTLSQGVTTSNAYAGSSSTTKVPAAAEYYDIDAVKTGTTSAKADDFTLTDTDETLTSFIVTQSAAATAADDPTYTIGTVTGNGNGTFNPTTVTCTMAVGATTCTFQGSLSFTAATIVDVESTGGNGTVTASWTTTWTTP